jgi:hypothetical protein
MAEPESPNPRPSPLDALTRRLSLGGEGWGRRLTLLVLLLLVSVAAGFVISPGLYSQQIPALTEEHLGRPFRANSPAGFKAARDYEIPHNAMTEQRRQEARGAVRPVYDLNPEVVDRVRTAVKTTFSEMRGRLAAKAAEASAESREEEGEVRKEGDARKAAEARKPRRPVPLTPEEVERQRKEREAMQGDFQELLFGQRDAALEAEDFQALLANGFSEEAEAATLVLLERAYGSERGPIYIAGSREELTREGPQGITVRDVRHSG